MTSAICSIRSRKSRAVHVAQPDGQRAADLVAVARPDAAHRGADRLAAGTLLVQQPVLLDVPGEDHVGPVADHQVLADLDAAGDQAVDLGQQAGRVEHHAAGDDALHLGPEDAAGDQRELERLAAGHDGVPGVGPALVADDDLVLLGQQIDDLALRLVAPLQSDHARARHSRGPKELS